MKKTKEEVLSIVKKDGRALRDFPDYQNDRDVVLAAVKQNGFAIHYASLKLKKDDTIVYEALEQNCKAIDYVDVSYRDDINAAKIMLKQNGLYLKKLSDRLRENAQIVLIAVRQNGLALEHALKDLNCNKSIILNALAQNLKADQFIGEKFGHDAEVEAFKIHPKKPEVEYPYRGREIPLEKSNPPKATVTREIDRINSARRPNHPYYIDINR